jgi:hypothetical protein
VVVAALGVTITVLSISKIAFWLYKRRAAAVSERRRARIAAV